ncbi:MAG TPA: DNA-directed RNA polymerase subunit beta, partial [Acidobacteriota bacterium]|nr:DNA-directed RNA polymerase subunit beta [Acidobacteriota bacterium]
EPTERLDVGLHSVLSGVFPISDFRDTCSLEYVGYEVGNPKYSLEECQERGMTYAAPLKVTTRLVVWDKDPETEEKTIRDIKEQDVYFGDIPLMTENGLFIVNGTERVIVSQLHRSPGVFFESNNQRTYFLGKVIPYRGSWVEFEYEAKKDLLYVRIDRKRKFLATTFLRALGLESNSLILRTFYRTSSVSFRDGRVYCSVDENLLGRRLERDVLDPRKEGGILIPAGRKVTKGALAILQKAEVQEVEVTPEYVEQARSVDAVVNPETGEILLESNAVIDRDALNRLLEAGVGKVEVFYPDLDPIGDTLCETLAKDTVKTKDEALIEIYRKQRPGDPP